MGIANESLVDGRLLLAADALYLDWRSAALFKNLYRGQWVMQLGAQYRATDRVKLRLGYALAQNPIDPTVGTQIGPITVPGGIPSVKYLQSQFAIVNEHRMAAGAGIEDLFMPGLDLDVFAGGTGLQASDLRALIKRIEGDRAELRPGLLRLMDKRAVLLRLQNNIKLRRLRGGDLGGALACTEDMLRLAPDQALLWREAGLMNQRLDRISAALQCLDRSLTIEPEGETARRIRTVVEELRQRLN
jgi:tetratricopeptide (TPR) repeat protein